MPSGNGMADPAEGLRLPNVSLSIGGVSGRTAAGGRFSLAAVPEGMQPVQINSASLPAYFSVGPAQSLTVPAGSEVGIPVLLALGSNAHPNLYMAIGDSITVGDGSSDRRGYLPYLENDLDAYWGGTARLVNEGVEAKRSTQGEAMIGAALRRNNPAYALVLFGTNDFNNPACKSDLSECDTVDALRSMILQTRDAGALPVLGTVPPVNPEWLDHNPDERNEWARQINVLVRAMAAEQHVALADIHADFLRKPTLSSLFRDDKHPNDAGYEVIARSFFDAITRPVGASASGRSGPGFVPSIGR